jgi:hypothetical protein
MISVMTGVTEAAMPNIMGGDEGGEGARRRRRKRVKLPRIVAPKKLGLCLKVLQKPKGSNSTEQLLSVVKRRIKIRVLMMCGVTKT